MLPQVHLILLSFLCSFHTHHSVEDDQAIVNRIAYIYNLKHTIDKRVWKGFTNKEFDLPLVYYTNSACYVANPTEKFIAVYKPELLSSGKELKIYKTILLDSLPFHMETNVVLGDTSSRYDFKSPFMNCSSYEITNATVPDMNGTEQWATMIMHEYFHGFQLKHPNFLNYFEKHVAVIPADSLTRIYKSKNWFKESMDKENELLLAALAAKDKKQIKNLVDQFFRVREQRRAQVKEQLHFTIEPIEQAFEKMEGTARYVEFSLYDFFSKKKPDEKLVTRDTAYHSYRYFKNYQMERDEWLYKTDKTTYFYATGFNLVRLLEKLNIPYQHRLFNEGNLSLETLLKLY